MSNISDFSQAIQDSVALLRSAIPAPSDQIRLLSSVYGNMLLYLNPVGAAIRQSILSELCKAVSDYVLSSRGEAESILSMLSGLFESELSLTDNTTAWQALRDLRTALVSDLTSRSLRLPELITIVRRVPLPSVVLAYQLYQDARRADEIVYRNVPRHPLFCSITNEVLSS